MIESPAKILWIITIISIITLPLCYTQSSNVTPPSRHRADPPVLVNGKPTEVYVGLYIESMSSLILSDMSTTIDAYFRVSWQDPSIREHAGLINDKKHIKMFWRPDIIFPNAKNAIYHDVFNTNVGMWIDSNGTVAYSARITMTVSCPMHLAYYPFDYQICEIIISSFSHTFKEMPLKWFPDDPIEVNPDIFLPEYEVMFSQTKAAYCDGGSMDGKQFTYRKTKDTVKKEKFGCLSAQLQFGRQFGFHLVATYIPSAVVVMISWVGFWLEPTAVPARVSLTFTTLLTLTTMGAGLRFSLPKVSYVKAIDVWFLACMAFVFAALIEFAICNSYVRRAMKCDETSDRMLLLKAHGTSKLPKTDTGYSAAGFSAALLNNSSAEYKRKARRTDRICSVMFPLLFIVFNICYWLYYLVDFEPFVDWIDGLL